MSRLEINFKIMGGENSKRIRVRTTTRSILRRKSKEKAITFDPLPEPDAPPDTDSRLPLDARQVFKLKKSWKGIKRNIHDTAVEMFVR